MIRLETLPIFCAQCERKVYIRVDLMQRNKAKCPCGHPIKMTPEFAAFVGAV